MALSVPYAIKVPISFLSPNYLFWWYLQLGKALQSYNLKWIEECLPPDDYSGYSQLHSALRGTTLVTTGEHEYTRYITLSTSLPLSNTHIRYGFRLLIESECADILQPDITWLGGITEVRTIMKIFPTKSYYNTLCLFRLDVWLLWHHHMTYMWSHTALVFTLIICSMHLLIVH